MKGIILAGGSGTRLYPITKGISKQSAPIYDKPMIYYPLSVLMLAGIRDILIISTPIDLPRFKDLFGDGNELGLNISYAEQPSPDGLAQAFIIGEDFIGDDSVSLILGDNIFYGYQFSKSLMHASELTQGAMVFGYYVNDPERYGVVEFNKEGKAIGLEEKPENPKSNFAIPWIYFYPNDVAKFAKTLKKSERWEYEIVDLHKKYLDQNRLKVEVLPNWYEWFDTWTHKSLIEASKYIELVEERQWLKIACLEEIAYIKWWIWKDDILKQAEKMKNSSYWEYLRNLV